MAYCHWNYWDHRRASHVPCPPDNGARSCDLYRSLGAHDRGKRDCDSSKAAPGNQRRMVFDSYGSGINRLCHATSMEPCRRRRRRDLAHRMVCGCNGGSCRLFWLPAAQFADAAGVVVELGSARVLHAQASSSSNHELLLLLSSPSCWPTECPCCSASGHAPLAQPAAVITASLLSFAIIRLWATSQTIPLRRWNINPHAHANSKGGSHRPC